jgi:hypothetical protein
MLNTFVGAGAVGAGAGAGATSRYGSGSDQMMRLRLRNTGQNFLKPFDFFAKTKKISRKHSQKNKSENFLPDPSCHPV